VTLPGEILHWRDFIIFFTKFFLIVLHSLCSSILYVEMFLGYHPGAFFSVFKFPGKISTEEGISGVIEKPIEHLSLFQMKAC